MNRVVFTLILMAGFVTVAWAEMYRLENVKRLDSNIYKAGNLIIKTRYCYHYAYGEDAIYDDTDHKLIWKDGDSPCEVEGIYR